MRRTSGRKALQWVIGILATAPLVSGMVGLTGIFNPMFLENLPENTLLDSNLRFLNAMAVGIALSFYAIIPVIEKQTFALRILCASIFCGGLGRILSILSMGMPAVPFIVFLCIELISPVILIFWQKKVSADVMEPSS